MVNAGDTPIAMQTFRDRWKFERFVKLIERWTSARVKRHGVTAPYKTRTPYTRYTCYIQSSSRTWCFTVHDSRGTQSCCYCPVASARQKCDFVLPEFSLFFRIIQEKVSVNTVYNYAILYRVDWSRSAAVSGYMSPVTVVLTWTWFKVLNPIFWTGNIISVLVFYGKIANGSDRRFQVRATRRSGSRDFTKIWWRIVDRNWK